jgi:hypothetical protein
VALYGRGRASKANAFFGASHSGRWLVWLQKSSQKLDLMMMFGILDDVVDIYDLVASQILVCG